MKRPPRRANAREPGQNERRLTMDRVAKRERSGAATPPKDHRFGLVFTVPAESDGRPYVTANEIASALGIGRTSAYEIMRHLGLVRVGVTGRGVRVSRDRRDAYRARLDHEGRAVFESTIARLDAAVSETT